MSFMRNHQLVIKKTTFCGSIQIFNWEQTKVSRSSTGPVVCSGARHQGHLCSRTAPPPVPLRRHGGLGESKEHEMLGYCSMPSATRRSQGHLLVHSALSCFKFRKHKPQGQPWARGFLQPQEGQEVTWSWGSRAVPFILGMLSWSYFSKIISNRKYQYLYI